MRALMGIDLTQSLILGCYIPVTGDCVIWVYFRYGSVYRFCKRCGRVGHNFGNCGLRIDVAARRLSCRLKAVERDYLRVLHGPLDSPYYTYFIRGFPDTFRFRNRAIDLTRLEEPDDALLRARNQFDDKSDSDFNSDESNDTVYFSGSDSSSSSGVEDDNARVVRIGRQALNHSPGRRIGLRQDPYAEYTPPNLNHPPAQTNLGLNTFSNSDANNRVPSPTYSPIRRDFHPDRGNVGASNRGIFSPPPLTAPRFGGSTFEVEESSSAAAAI
uniref:Zinc knuckle CX2CX4HX4C domain-containing protein n=1 Tax=Chenopodium quinoa TaxID=63459 RepID=A0A803L3U0_CHEQI